MQTTAANYRKITIRPEQFQEILLDKVCVEFFFWNTIFLFLVTSIPVVALPIYHDFIQILMADV